MKAGITGLLAGAVSGLAAAVAFPPAGLWGLAWIALVPLFLRVRAQTEGADAVAHWLAVLMGPDTTSAPHDAARG